MSINEGQFKISGFASKQDLLEHQVKEYQAFMREQTVRIEALEAKNVELEAKLAEADKRYINVVLERIIEGV